MPAARSLFPLALLLAACAGGEAPAVEGGNAERGRELVAFYDCVDCHVIPGVPEKAGAIQKITLENFAHRERIARGTTANTPASLVAFIQHPREADPRTTMPGIGRKEADARDIAAFLYTLD